MKMMKSLKISGVILIVALAACKGSSETASSTNVGGNSNTTSQPATQTAQPDGNQQVKPVPTLVPASQIEKSAIKKEVPASK